MPKIEIKQDTINGTASDGRRDGTFFFDQSPTLTPNYFLVHEIRPGFYREGTNIGQIGSWVRFKIPLPKDKNIRMTDAYIIFHWSPPIDNDTTDDILPSANHNYNQNWMKFKVAVWPSYGANASWPMNQAEAESMWDQANFWNIEWDDDHTRGDPGWGVLPIATVSFHEYLQFHTTSAADWQEGFHVLLFITGFQVNTGSGPDRWLNLKSWSANNAEGVSQDTAPMLVIEYEYDTPAPTTYTAKVEHTLTFEQEIDEVGKRGTIESTLTITQDIGVVREFNRIIEHELDIEHEWAVIGYGNSNVEHFITITQIIGVERHRSYTVENTLNIGQIIEVNENIGTNKSKTVYHTLDIQQDIDAVKEMSRSVENTIEFDQDIDQAGLFKEEVVHTLVITQTISTAGSILAKPIHVEHTLVIEQWVGPTPFSGIQTANKVVTRAVEHTVTFTQKYVGYSDNGQLYQPGGTQPPPPIVPPPGVSDSGACDRPDLRYSPADTSSTFPAVPVIKLQHQVKLEYPVSSPTNTIILPSPLFGNREELYKTRIQRKTRAGDLVTYEDPTWPDWRVFRYKFEDLDDTLKANLFAFMGVALAQQVKLTDHEGRIWHGVIINPNGEYATIYRTCGTTTEFDFEGVYQGVVP